MESNRYFQWLTEGIDDFEYKKYIILAYLKSVETTFEQNEFYPTLSELSARIGLTKSLLEGKNKLTLEFPKTFTHIDWKNLQLVYKQIPKDKLTSTLEDVLHFILPKLEKSHQTGQSKLQFFADHLQIEPVGLNPRQLDQGYLFVRLEQFACWHIYFYQKGIYLDDCPWPNLHLQFYQKRAIERFENLNKLKNALLSKSNAHWATFAIYPSFPMPYEQTLKPLAKQALLRLIMPMPS